jgi:hypothetical protein
MQKRPLMTSIIFIWAIFVVPFILMMMYWHKSYESKLETNASLKTEIQFDINKLETKRDELRQEKIDIMADWFNSDTKNHYKKTYPSDQMTDMEIFLQS